MQELWMGTAASFEAYCRAWQQFEQGLYSGASFPDDDEEEETPRYFDLQGNLGIVSVKGPLTNKDTYWNWMSGVTSYNDIRNGLIEAANHPGVETILLNVDSSGGAASGVSDIGHLVRMISTQIKPVVSYSGGTMGSAAYWIGASASEVYANEMATVGSIGAITVHMDLSKALSNEGVKPTVISAGEYKAVGNPYEALDAKSKAYLQSRIDVSYDRFISHVSLMRGVPEGRVREVMAEGKAFIGYEALDAGLIDGVMSLDQLVQKLQSRQNEVTMANKRKLTTSTVAQLASGVDLNTALESSPEVEDTQTPDSATEGSSASLETQPAAPALDASTETPPASEETQAPVMAAAAQIELMQSLQQQLVSQMEIAAGLKAANVALEAELATLRVQETQLCEVVAERIGHMQIALGSQHTDLSDLPATNLLALHSKVKTQFEKTFPVGGVASKPDTTEPKPPVVSTAAKLRAVRR